MALLTIIINNKRDLKIRELVMNPKEVSVMVPLKVYEATIEMLLVKQKENIEKLLTQGREYLKNSLEKDKTIFQLEQQLADFKYYKLLVIARNEIDKYDAFAWNTNFQYVREDLEYIMVYEDRQVEKRRQRWLHLLKHSDEALVRRIRNSIMECKITVNEFALNIAQAYRELSKKIHDIVYSSVIHGEKCESLTSSPVLNECLNVIMSNVDLNVGKVISGAKKRKLSDLSDLNETET